MAGDSEALIERAVGGDASALRQLVELHEPGLYAFVRVRMGPALRARESVRDLLQEILLELVRGIASVEFRDEAAFRGWLYVLAERRIRDRARYHRREKREAGLERHLDGESASEVLLARAYSSLSSPLHRLQRLEEIEAMERAFERLSTKDREVLTLAFFCGMSSRQIGETLGVTEELARRRKNRARVRLATLWAGLEPED